MTTTERETKSALLSQNVTVTPGCFLVLSFADNYRNLGLGAIKNPKVRARVFYVDADPVDLINIEINYHDEVEDKGFVFHQKVANVPVPLNVSTVTVEFFITTEDIGDVQNSNQTVWLLDGVSLRNL